MKRHQALLVALAAHHDHAGVALGRRARQRHQFGDAQARGVEHLEQAIEPESAQPFRRRGLFRLAQLLGAAEHAVDIRDRQHLGQAAAARGAGQDRGRIITADALVEEEAVEMPHRRQAAGDAGGFEAADVEIGEIVAQRLRFRVHKIVADAA